MKVSDILPLLSLMKSQDVHFYSKEGMKIRTSPRSAVMTDPCAAVGATLWDCEVIQINAPSHTAFNLTVILPDGRIRI